MDFNKVEYVRPNLAEFKDKVHKLSEQLKNATNGLVAQVAATELVALVNDVNSQEYVASIRYSIDTNDTFYKGESDFWDEYGPQFSDALTEYQKAVVASPFQDELAKIYPHTLIDMTKDELRVKDTNIIPLQQEDNRLISEYSDLIANAQVDFRNQTYTLAQLGPLMSDEDRDTRRDANAAYWGFFAQNEATFDRIYDDMVHVRTQMAHELGFKDYSEMSYVFMDRFDYDEAMVSTYRHEIETKVVPLVLAQRAKQAKRLGLDKLEYYDLGIQFKSGNAKPEGTPEELVETARQMYHEMSAETGPFFDHMVSSHLLDLLAKPGKMSGGYAEYIPSIESPFIFANFNGTSGDVDVLTHEAGHAFQTTMAKWIQPGETVFPTNDAAEIFSMSMEFIAYPWMQNFFKDQTAKYKYAHLQSALEFLPYGILVDHFQHEVYTHPDWTPAERKACWRELELRYNPDKDYSENPDLDRGIYWMRQGHIFEVPFYYLDYTIAQVVAYQFWKRFEVDHDKSAWPDYLAMAKAGGSQSLLELLQTGHLQSPFEPGALDDTLAAIKSALDAVDDSAL
ncbi:M3 family oligoendopeptidase [Lacticaseibacillus hulanensis]|uniref:M3 family oligoendopeptidase n=1 Tax=Lacticaseibacillus hulanensis TaxID=2493111 RepID=UPI000FDC300E|nr:M3 family oligoendopeptidase [Lacticaseibacillus hulanensis]